MNIRDKISTIEDKIKSLDDQLSQLSTQIVDLTDERAVLYSQVLREENLLKNTLWDVRGIGASASGIYLQFIGSKQDEIYKLLSMLLTEASSIEVEPGAYVNQHNGDISIRFSSTKDLSNFIIRYKIQIDNSNLVSRLRSLKREVSALETLCHIFGIQS